MLDLDKRKYVAVNRDHLPANASGIKFDIYARMTGDKKDRPVLLFKKDTPYDELVDILTNKHFKELYILNADNAEYWILIEDSMKMIIKDEHISLDEKSSLVYKCATETVKAVFEDPRSGVNIERCRKVTNNIIDFALDNKDSIPSLLKLGSHDYYTFTHCVNVAVFAIGLFQCIGRGTEDELRDFALGCILHDVGKTDIDKKILNKPGKLTDAEFDRIKRHPVFGAVLMKGMVPDIALDVILHHHEQFDGRGYPEGLTGDHISDYARMSAIADVYDALTTNRSYARARSPFDAALLMKEKMVGHFEQEKFIEFIHFLSGDSNNR
ncbi:MAG: HD domain-containing protein [Thermodesulfobacteriota bacterium]|nr:HD domain-containing protein [Thermodesulfobacteriota bacterium]